jgi:hypothetical protein
LLSFSPCSFSNRSWEICSSRFFKDSRTGEWWLDRLGGFEGVDISKGKLQRIIVDVSEDGLRVKRLDFWVLVVCLG